MITRRALFTKAMQLSAAGVFITAMPSKLIAETLEVATDDYDISLSLAREVLAHTKSFASARGNAPINKLPVLAQFHCDQVRAIGDKLISFMCDKFPPDMSDEEIAAVKTMFLTRDVRKLAWQGEPRVMFGAVFTITIVLELINAKAPFTTDPKQMPSFARFATQYKPLIMDSSPPARVG